MTLRIRIDRLVIDRSLLAPGQLAEFRAGLDAELARVFADRMGAHSVGAAARATPIAAGATPALRLAGQVARSIGSKVARP